MNGWRVTAILAALSFGTTASAEPVADFYTGKSVTIVVGSAPGGGYDALARLMSRHLGRFVPGHPTMVVQNMPGAGSFVAANNLYNLLPKDGTTIGLVQRTILSANVTHQKVRFDVRKFNWIGNLADEISLFLAWHTAPVKTAQDMFTKEFVMGGGGPTSDSEVQTRMLNALIGTKIKIVSGYPGQAQILLAMERGEVQGMGGWGYSNLQMHIDLLKEKKINLLLQGSLKRTPELPDVPTPFEFAKHDEDRKVLALFYLQQTVGRPVLAPPNVLSDRLKALRTAFVQMGRDQRFRADAAKAHLDVDPTSNESIEKVVQAISTASPATIERFAELNAPPSKH